MAKEIGDTLIINIPVARQLLRDLLCTAIESGGCDYWAEFSDAQRTGNMNYLSVRVKEHEAHDGKIRVHRIVTADQLAIGMERLAQAEWPNGEKKNPTFYDGAAFQHLADALSDHDATTADVVLQMTIFGELIYG